jgi:hypothetical protein
MEMTTKTKNGAQLEAGAVNVAATKQATVTNADQIKELKSTLKVLMQNEPKKVQTERQLRRKDVNNKAKCELMSFINVFTLVKKNHFQLTNRAPKALIRENANLIYDFIELNVSDKMYTEILKVSPDTMKTRFARFETVLSNINLFIHFFPGKEQEKIKGQSKAFSVMNMIDMICRILMYNDGNYQKIVDSYKAQK